MDTLATWMAVLSSVQCDSRGEPVLIVSGQCTLNPSLSLTVALTLIVDGKQVSVTVPFIPNSAISEWSYYGLNATVLLIEPPLSNDQQSPSQNPATSPATKSPG